MSSERASENHKKTGHFGIGILEGRGIAQPVKKKAVKSRTISKNRNLFTAIIIAVIVSIAIASITTVFIFDTPFAHDTIDYFSFAAALFLIIEGFYKIKRHKNEPYLPNQLLRHIRIIIGTCVFTIHIMQYIYCI